MERNIIVVIVLIVLVLLTVVQTVQLGTLKKQIAEGGKLAVSSGASGGAGASVPSSLDNLPNMVGGC